jgi:cell division protein ZapA
MAQVTVRINGYAYTVGCQDGEEQHLQQMAEQVERRIDSIKAVAGQSGESRMLVMAALLMADDLFEMGKSLKEAQAAQSGQAAQPADGGPAAPAPDTKLNRRLGKLAKRAEDIAAELGQP